MTANESKKLKIGDEVYFGDDPQQTGKVVDTGYHAVAINWKDRGDGEPGVGHVDHEGMTDIHRVPAPTERNK